MTPIPTAAPDVAEDVVLPALRLLGPAWWGVAPAEEQVTGRLTKLASDPRYLRRYWVAQHQDGGGRLAPLIGSAGWRGLVTVRCLSADIPSARQGRDLAWAAMNALSAPTGYSIQVQWVGWLIIPRDPDGIQTRGFTADLTIRRVPAS